MRQRICAGNWKMHKTAADTAVYLTRFLELASSVPQSVELVICPPFTAIPAAAGYIREQSRVKLGAQDMHWETQGAFTGAVSAPMLLEFGVQYVILGHSERRQYFGETDEMVRRKTAAALAAGLTPIVAVGESLDIRRAGNARGHVVAQVLGALTGLEPADLRRVVIAYEPIWAIGTGENCDPADADEIMAAIRGCMDGLHDVPVLYGGSVKAENIAQYVAQPNIDGGLVGGASLDPDGFISLAKGAA